MPPTCETPSCTDGVDACQTAILPHSQPQPFSAAFPARYPAHGLFSWLPSRCAACRHWPSHGLCANCYALFLRRTSCCIRCAIPMPATAQQICGQCLTHPFAFDATIAAVPYTDSWRQLVQRFKFHQGTEYARVIAQLMQMTIAQHLNDNRPDLIVPIAAAPSRMRERGYNQAWEIARPLAKLLQLPCASNVLIRTHEHDSQTHRKRKERFKALRHAFTASPRWQGHLAEKHIALVDDVMTTGATLDAAARALKAAGAGQVSAWVFARTPEQRNQR